MPQNGVERPFSAICVHYCIPTGRPRDPRAATVYTNAPKQLREAVFGDLCTLLRHHGASARLPRVNSVHKWLRTASKGRFRRSVYTIVSPRASRAGLAPQQCTQMPRNGSVRPFSAICVHYCVTTGLPRGPRAAALSATVYTNVPKRLREAAFGDLCTLLCHHGPPARPSRRNSVHKWLRTASKGRFRRSVYTIASPPASRAGLAPQQCTQMPRNGVERSFSAICVHYCVPLRHHGPPAS